MRYLKLASLIFGLTVIMILSAFLFSCNANNPDSNGNNSGNTADNPANNTTQDNSAETTAEEKITYNVPDIDYGGYNFRVVDRDGVGGIYWVTADQYAEAENGDPINDAVYRRNSVLENKFNIKISEIRKADADLLPFIQKSIQAGSDDFDVFYTHMQNAGTLVQKALLTNLYDITYFEFDKPWWDISLNKSMTVAKKLYAAAGAITTTTNDATWCVLFNKDLLQNYAISDPYQLVNDGKWTMDVMYANSKIATKDLNGDGVITPDDLIGTIGQHECAFCLFAGSGQKIVDKDSEDLPVLSLNSDRTVNVLAKVVEFMTDKNSFISADDYMGKYKDVWTEITSNRFSASGSLYEITNFDMVKTLRNMAANFGILPLPKLDETQPQYYSTMQYNNATVMCIPVSAKDLERTGAILEAWAGESVNTLTKAYYDITLKGKYSRDDESSQMLDLIFSTRVMDLGMFFNWSGMQGFFESFVTSKKSLDFVSQYEKNEPKWTKEINKTIQAIQAGN